MSAAGGQPIIILKEGTQRERGRDARRNNIMAAMVVAQAVKSSLGPLGMDKMLVDSFGEPRRQDDGGGLQDPG
jgi:chaperonin GroEL (HSP60 family)